MDVFPAKLDSIPLEIETIEDSIEKAIVRHEIPYKNGALLEDMGQKARPVRVRCYFWDDEAGHETYDNHKALLAHLKRETSFELSHPQYGLMRGAVESVTVRHDERTRLAEVELVFVEALREPAEDSEAPDVVALAESACLGAQGEALRDFNAEAGKTLGPQAWEVLARELDPQKGILEQFGDLTGKARVYVAQLDKLERQMGAYLGAVVNPVNSLLATVRFGANLPDRVMGAVARAVERTALLYVSLKDSPARFLTSVRLGLLDLELAAGRFSRPVRLAGASRLGLEAAYVYRDDQGRRAQQIRAEKQPRFDVLGNAVGASVLEPVMSVPELEQSLAEVREYQQGALDLARECENLKALALALLTHVNTVKLERENLTVVELDNAMPLHLLCLRQGLPYQAAERLLTVNPQMRHPNFAAGVVNVYVR